MKFKHITRCAGQGNNKAAYSLTEGLGARRLQQVKVRLQVQSLLVQSCAAIYEQSRAIMSDAALETLLDTVSTVCDHSRQVRAVLSSLVACAVWRRNKTKILYNVPFSI